MTSKVYDASEYTDVMVDLETLGTAPGSVIISLGAVFFAAELPEEEWATYETLINFASSRSVGLTEDVATHLWWSQQSEEARKTYDAVVHGGAGEHLVNVLQAFAQFFPTGARLWGNGANFDNVLLATAYRKAAVNCPWRYHSDHCYRTMKNEFDMVMQPVFQGTQHNALADALHQTRHLVQILAYKSLAVQSFDKSIAESLSEKASKGGD